MSKITILFGFLLCAISVCILLVKQEVNSVSIFIPTFVGVPLILLGVLTLIRPSLRMHLMHAAVTIGLLGGLAALGRGVTQLIKVSRGDSPDPTAAASVWSMTVLCLVYVVLCVRSFIAARIARKASEAEGKA